MGQFILKRLSDNTIDSLDHFFPDPEHRRILIDKREPPEGYVGVGVVPFSLMELKPVEFKITKTDEQVMARMSQIDEHFHCQSEYMYKFRGLRLHCTADRRAKNVTVQTCICSHLITATASTLKIACTVLNTYIMQIKDYTDLLELAKSETIPSNLTVEYKPNLLNEIVTSVSEL